MSPTRVSKALVQYPILSKSQKNKRGKQKAGPNSDPPRSFERKKDREGWCGVPRPQEDIESFDRNGYLTDDVRSRFSFNVVAISDEQPAEESVTEVIKLGGEAVASVGQAKRTP